MAFSTFPGYILDIIQFKCLHAKVDSLSLSLSSCTATATLHYTPTFNALVDGIFLACFVLLIPVCYIFPRYYF